MSGPVAAEPRVSPALVRPLGKAHPDTGNQAQVIAPPVTGYSGAWAAPIRKRSAINPTSVVVADPSPPPGINPTIRFSTPQSTATIVRVRRAPIRSPNTPPGNWKIP